MLKRNMRRSITVVMVLVFALMFVSSMALAEPVIKYNEDKHGRIKVHVKTKIMKLGEIEEQHHYGKVSFKLKETKHGDYKVDFKLDFKHAMKNTEYEIFVWANIPDVTITMYGNLLNNNWKLMEFVAVLYGYDTDYTINGKIETSTSTLGFSGYHVLDTGHDIMTDHHGHYKYKCKDKITEEEGIEYAIGFAWPYIKEHLCDTHPLLSFFLPTELDLTAMGVTSVTIHGGTYSLSTGASFVGSVDTYYTEPLSHTFIVDDLVWTV